MKEPFTLSFPIDLLYCRYHNYAQLVNICKSFINLRPINTRRNIESRPYFILDKRIQNLAQCMKLFSWLSFALHLKPKCVQ